MTISVSVSVNGNYKCPVSYKQGGVEGGEVVSGRGHDGPKILTIPFSHGADALTLTVGPEEQDNGEDPGVQQQEQPPFAGLVRAGPAT